ncbi:glycosyltransferase family 2 protein [Candidatus Acetothermia bacterium]|nr:glycosyltransferase family 2 protein [Candidatus Acetothermia bacterium]MBI3660793.1 glycosyltransferase family 2 protein [Candidatus Acetothermia bacterium]
MKVTAIIPAYNEATRIGQVLLPLKASSLVDEIIVVDDGSQDETSLVAKRYGVSVIELPVNRGKAAALDEGVQFARNDVLLFLDADLIGLETQHIDKMILNYFEYRVDMVIGVFKNGRLNTDLSQKFSPYLSGQRVLRKELWSHLRKQYKLEFGVEMALTKVAIKKGLKRKLVELDGVTHVMKEVKRGFSQGFVDRLKMYSDIVRSVFTRVA